MKKVKWRLVYRDKKQMKLDRKRPLPLMVKNV